MNWEIKVKKVTNGYLAEWWEDGDDNAFTEFQQVFEEPDNETGELEAMQNLLWFIKETFGVMHSKHNKRNLVVEIQENEDA